MDKDVTPGGWTDYCRRAVFGKRKSERARKRQKSREETYTVFIHILNQKKNKLGPAPAGSQTIRYLFPVVPDRQLHGFIRDSGDDRTN